MSYTIIYDKLFIKLPNDMFIPMALYGDNNVYDWNNVRSRGWSCLIHSRNRQAILSREEILAVPEQIRKDVMENQLNRDEHDTEENIIKHFGYYTSIAVKGNCKGTSYGKYKGVYSSGIKNALTVEEIRKIGISISITVKDYNYHNEGSGNSFERARYSPQTTEQLLEEYKAAQEVQASSFNYYTEDSKVRLNVPVIYIEYDLSWKYVARCLDNYKLHKRIDNGDKKDKIGIGVDNFWVLKNEKGYFLKYTARGYKYVFHAYGGKKFIDEFTIDEYLDRIKNRGHNWQKVNVEEKAHLYLSQSALKSYKKRQEEIGKQEDIQLSAFPVAS